MSDHVKVILYLLLYSTLIAIRCCYFWVLTSVFYSDCFRKRYGTDYEGNIDATLSGRKCQSWTSNQPHNHTFNKPYLFADPDVDAASNFCRNPHQEDTGRIRPWCLTTDQQVEWEYCNVPQCDDAGKNWAEIVDQTLSNY